MAGRIFLLVLSLICTFSCATGDSNETDVPFGSCLVGRESCSECYLALKKSLLRRDDNIFNLSLAFYPPQHSIPVFVSITYVFGGAPNAITQKWFWTHDSSYLFFPLQTFQYHSLFFGKLAGEVSQTLILTLDEECSASPHKTMELLTQRLKDFIERKRYNPQIDQNYFAKALLNTDDILDETIADLIIVFYALGSFFVAIIIVVMIVLYLFFKRWDRKLKRLEPLANSNRHLRSKIHAVAAVCWLWNVYILALDITALIKENKNLEKKLNPLSIIVLVFTSVAFLWSTTLQVVSHCISKCNFIFLALSMLGPTFAVVIHLPYMVIAFLNDAYYASSVFTFYTIATFALFGALNFVIGTCQVALLHAEKHLFVIDKLTNIPTISVNHINNQRAPQQVPPQNAARVALHFKPGTQMETMQANIVQQSLSLTKLQFPQEQAPNNNQFPLNLTLTFGAAGATSTFDCKLISNVHATQESTKVNITVPREVTLAVTHVEHKDNLITFTFEENSSIININSGRLKTHSIHRWPSFTMTRAGTFWIYFFLLPLFIGLLLALIALIACVLIFVPINDAFADAPNRLIGFYQSAGILVAAYIAYDKFFKDKPSLEGVIKRRRRNIPTDRERTDEEWQQLSNDEKVDAFYSRIVSMAADYDIGQGGGAQGGVPHGGVPQGGGHQGGVPHGGVPQGGGHQGGVSHGGVPQGGVPHGGVPQGGVPQGGVPQGGIPQGVRVEK